MKIAIIGSGKVANALVLTFLSSPHTIIGIWSRSKPKWELHKNVDIDFFSIEQTIPECDIALIAVADDAISAVSKLIVISPTTILAHTSGTVPSTVLSNRPLYGVFYPLQTIRAEHTLAADTPIVISGNQLGVAEMLEQLAQSLTNSIHKLSDDQRKNLHLAAVMANNFTNYIISEAYHYLKEQDISTILLKPLISETMSKLIQISPDTTQTGPAARGDHRTLQSHLDLLEDTPQLQELYRLVSNLILVKNKHATI